MKRCVLRGGSFNFGTRVLRTTHHGWGEPENRFRYFGFRILVKRRKHEESS